MSHSTSLLGILCLTLLVVVFAEHFQESSSEISPYSGTNITPSSSRKQLQYKTSGVYKELPEPGTPAAHALIGDPKTSGSVRQVYTYSQDSTVITPELTASFLQRLQQQLQAHPSLAGKNSSSKSSINLQPFIEVSADVLSYLRYRSSTVLLDLLRKFCISNGSQLDISKANPAQLRSEVVNLLNITTLDAYYRATSNRDGYRGGSSRTVTPQTTSSLYYPPQESAQVCDDSGNDFQLPCYIGRNFC